MPVTLHTNKLHINDLQQAVRMDVLTYDTQDSLDAIEAQINPENGTLVLERENFIQTTNNKLNVLEEKKIQLSNDVDNAIESANRTTQELPEFVSNTETYINNNITQNLNNFVNNKEKEIKGPNKDGNGGIEGDFTNFVDTISQNIDNKKSEILDLISELSESENIIAETFDASKSYNVGDYVILKINEINRLYRFITNHTGAWNNAHVIEVNITKELKNLKSYVTPEMYGAVGDGITDDTEAIQNAINNSPNKTIVFTNKYIVSRPIVTSANDNEKVFFQFLQGAIIIASNTFDGDAVIIFGLNGTRSSVHNTKFITGGDGITVDTNGKADGIHIKRTHCARLTKATILNVISTGIFLDCPENTSQVYSSDAYLSDIVVIGQSSDNVDCIGMVVNGHDNDIRNFRPHFVNIGMTINGSHNRISNAHPVRGGMIAKPEEGSTEYDEKLIEYNLKKAAYEASVAFIVNNSFVYFIDCYSDNFATAYDFQKRSPISYITNTTVLWWDKNSTIHRFIKVIDGEAKMRIRITGGDILFPDYENSQNYGIDAEDAITSIISGVMSLTNLTVNNKETLASDDALLYTLEQQQFEHTGIRNIVTDANDATRVNIIYSASSNAANLPSANHYNLWCIHYSSQYLTQFATIVNSTTPKLYFRTKQGEVWNNWEPIAGGDNQYVKIIPYDATLITDLSSIPASTNGRVLLSAEVSPTNTQYSYVYECIGDETRKVLKVYNVNENKRFVNYFGSNGWIGWETL